MTQRIQSLLSKDEDYSDIENVIRSGAVSYLVQFLDVNYIEKYCSVTQSKKVIHTTDLNSKMSITRQQLV